MERYTEYKYSGVQWLGEIPSHWGMERWRYLMNENIIKNSDCNIRLQLQFRYGDIVRKADQSEEPDVLDTISKYTIVEPNDIMINGLNLNYDFVSQRVAQVKEEGVITSAYISLRPTQIANSKYYTYFLKSMDAKKMFHGMGTGIRLTLSYNELKNQFIPKPSIKEQEAIANYLDSATSKIDKAIAQQQKMIDLLNERKQIIINNAITKGLTPKVSLKDSGIDWIGMIPEHWETIRLGFCSWIRARLGWKGLKANEYVDNGYAFLSAFNIQNNQLVWEPLNFINKFRYDESPEIKLKVGDILLVKDGAGIGKCARVDSMPKGEATANGSLAFISPGEKMHYRYLYYFIISNSFRKYTELLINGMGVPHFTQGEMKKVKVPLPPKDEQIVIADFLDSKVEKINKTINHYQIQISFLQERKQIIINDVVTGKVKVV